MRLALRHTKSAGGLPLEKFRIIGLGAEGPERGGCPPLASESTYRHGTSDSSKSTDRQDVRNRLVNLPASTDSAPTRPTVSVSASPSTRRNGLLRRYDLRSSDNLPQEPSAETRYWNRGRLDQGRRLRNLPAPAYSGRFGSPSRFSSSAM